MVVRLKINVWLPVQNPIEQSVNVEFISENIGVELHVVDHIVKGVFSWQLDCFVLFDFVQNLNHHHQGSIAGVGVHADFQLGSVVIWFEVLYNVIVDVSEEFRNDEESVVEVELVAEEPHDNFFKFDVLESVNFFCVVISNEGSVHFSDFELEGVLDEAASD